MGPGHRASARHAVLVEQLRERGITDLVVWGLRSNTHTHHYIHRGVHRVIEALGRGRSFRSHWFDDVPDHSRELDPHRTYLIFASPHYDFDRHLPVLENSYYVLHADWSRSWPTSTPITRYGDLADAGKAVFWRVFRGMPTKAHETIDREAMVFWDRSDARLTMPWATDLLPEEVDRSIAWVKRAYARRRLFPGMEALFVGSVWERNQEAIDRFARACQERGISFLVRRIHPVKKTVAATRRSFMAPAIQGEAHIRSHDEFYVPCRILKNISYGTLGVTNNPGVDRLLGGTVIFDTDLSRLVDRYRETVSSFGPEGLDQMITAMETVRDRHTYVDRLTTALSTLS